MGALVAPISMALTCRVEEPSTASGPDSCSAANSHTRALCRFDSDPRRISSITELGYDTVARCPRGFEQQGLRARISRCHRRASTIGNGGWALRLAFRLVALWVTRPPISTA